MPTKQKQRQQRQQCPSRTDSPQRPSSSSVRSTGCCCCRCTSAKTQARRKKIREISQPLRPDELNQVLARYGLFDESAMPSAWVAPFPPSSRSQPCALYDSSTASGRADTSTLPRSAYRGSQPSATTSVPSSQLPLLVQMSLQPDAGSSDQRSIPYGGGGGAASATDQPISPLAYSLSAELASVGKHRFRLTYVTDRLLVVSYPPDAQESDHNEGARWLCRAFERRYGQNYRIFNLSGFTKELHLSSQAPVIDLFWPAPLAPGLEQLVTAIDQLDYWLHNHDNGAVQYGLGMDEISVQPPGKIAVLHCTGPRSLLATYLAVYICQSKARFGPLCGQRPGSPTARGLQWTENRFRRFRNELVLGHMILKRFYEDNLARELSPSQKRYVGYFSGLVTGALILQDRLVYLHAVVYRNPSRGRFFTPSLEPITENNGNSIYAHPDELWRGTRYAQPSSSSSGLQAAQRGYWGTEQQREHPNVWDWGRLASIELSDSRHEDAASHFDGTFPTDQENLCRLTRKIESEMRPQRGAESSQTDYPQTIEPVRGFMDGEGGMLLKIYQNLKLMHTTKMLSPTSNFYVEKYIFPIEPVLPLHGDILIACFLKPDLSTCVQEIIFRLQFHTCATSTEKLSFYKHDLDEACSDNRFPPTGCVELYFSPNPELLREHKDNIDRGGYTWTSTDRESSILTVGLSDRRIDYLNLPADKQQLRYAAATAVGPSYVADQTRIATRSPPQPEEPLSILITTQEYIITTPTALYSTDSKPSEAPMWSEGGGPGQPGERPPARGPLVRQASDPLSHLTGRGRTLPSGPASLGGGTGWPHIPQQDAGLTPMQNQQQQIPLFQQALLSPRIQLPSAPGGYGKGAGYPSAPAATSLAGIESQIGRLNLAQLQALNQRLLQQYDQLLQQQQQRQKLQQQQALDQALAPADTGLYATVQRPAITGNLLSLLNNVQRAIAQQQQQRQPASLPYAQAAAPGVNAAQLLSSLNSSAALSNLARALLPSASLSLSAGEPSLTGLISPAAPSRIYPSPAGQPAPAVQSLQLTPQGLAYLPAAQARVGLPAVTGLQQPAPTLDPDLERLYLQLLTSRTSSSLQNTNSPHLQTLLRPGEFPTGAEQLQQADLLTDPQLLAEQRRRTQLQRTRLMLSEQERRLFDELRSLRQRRAGFPRQDISSRPPAGPTGAYGTPLENYRRATGRMAAIDTLRSRGRSRMLQAIGRSGSADAARLPYGAGDAYDLEQSEDAALLALLEQRLARTDARTLLSDTDGGGLRDNGDIPLKVVGPQQRSGHVVDGSSQAIMGDLAPGGAVRVFLPAEPPADVTSPIPPVSSGEYAALSEVAYPYESAGAAGLSETETGTIAVGEEGGDLERETGIYQRQPRIQLEPSPTGTPDARYPQQSQNHALRGRTYSGSLTPHSVPGPASRSAAAPASPSRRGRQWGQGSYDEQYGRPGNRHMDFSPPHSPVQTPSSRLLRSPVSPPARTYGRHVGGYMDTGSQSDTGLIGEHGSRGQWVSRGYRSSRGRGESANYYRGRPLHDRPLHSPSGAPLTAEGHGLGPLDHVPEAALIALNRLSASTHIWYRPEMSRAQAIDLVRSDLPGTFVVRNSGSFPRSFGLVLKMAQPSQGPSDDVEAVRHYLIEGLPPSTMVASQAIGVTAASLAPSNVPLGPSAMSVIHGAVRLRGCSNEPVFTNLVSLLYEHVVQPLALPCVLRLPFKSPTPTSNLPSLIALTRGGEPGDQLFDRARSRPPPTPGHTSEDSPRTGRRGDAGRSQLTRHPSDPLPGDITLGGAGTYYSSQSVGLSLPPGQYLPGRQDGLAPPPARRPMTRGRSPPSTYETEFGPSSAPSGSAQPSGGKWRAFTSIYLGSIDTENLTGASAIRKAVDVLLENAAQVKQTEVTLKVTQDGLTVTDNWRKLFFRRHYPFYSVSYCAVDPRQRCWESQELRSMGFKSAHIFGFVARKQNTRENMCHVLCDTPDCPASTTAEYIMHRLNEY